VECAMLYFLLVGKELCMEQIFMNAAHQVPAAGMDHPARVQALSKMIEDTAQSNHISQGLL